MVFVQLRQHGPFSCTKPIGRTFLPHYVNTSSRQFCPATSLGDILVAPIQDGAMIRLELGEKLLE
jgi:hypothetical protein